MFCPHCGAETTQGLNYCNRCGGGLTTMAVSPSMEAHPAISTGTAWAVGATTLLPTVVGLGILLGVFQDLAHSGYPPDVIKTVMGFSLLTLLGSVAVVAWLWSHLLGSSRRRAAQAPQLPFRQNAPQELNTGRISALPDAPAHSVIEHTTRTLEHVKRK
jgi:hypothetical protein